jgi:hypothetical protein
LYAAKKLTRWEPFAKATALEWKCVAESFCMLAFALPSREYLTLEAFSLVVMSKTIEVVQ